MIYVGIDVASEKHDVCILFGDGAPFRKNFQIKNTKQDYAMLFESIGEAKKLDSDKKAMIGIESTGCYSGSLVAYCASMPEAEAVLINPSLTHMFELSVKVHYAKTDSLDAIGICRFLMSGRALRTYTPPSYHAAQAKYLYREMDAATKSGSAEITRLQNRIHVFFPELLSVVGTVDSAKSIYILSKYPSPHILSRKRAVSLAREVSSKASRMSEEEAASIINAAKATVGDMNGFDPLLISSPARRLISIKGEKKLAMESAKAIVSEECPQLTSIPGLGIGTAVGIYGEIGEIGNFQSADSLVAFAGLDHIVYESGKFAATRTSISRKGSPYLRNAIYTAAMNVSVWSPTFKAYYEKKRGEGKSYRCAMCHCAKKLLKTVYHLLKTGEFYKEQN